jgi:hypothetical protein
MRAKKKKSHGVRSSEYGGCGKMMTCCFASFSWTSTEQCEGCYHVVTASSSCAKVQDAYDEMNCVDGKESPCTSACIQLLLLG